MSDIKERLAYLQGLANGYNLQDESKEGQILVEMLGVLDQMASTLMDIEETQTELESYVESLDSDLSELEGDFYGADEVVEVRCPECGTDWEVEETGSNGTDALDLTCPGCGEPLSAKELNNSARDK